MIICVCVCGLGVCLGFISNYAFQSLPQNLGWRVMIGLGVVPPIFLGLGVLAMPESPRWLVLQGRLGEAKQVLDKTSDSKEEAQLRLAEIKEAAGIPEECNDDVVQVSKRSHGEDVWKEFFIHPTPTVLHILIAGVGIHFFQQASFWHRRRRFVQPQNIWKSRYILRPLIGTQI